MKKPFEVRMTGVIGPGGIGIDLKTSPMSMRDLAALASALLLMIVRGGDRFNPTDPEDLKVLRLSADAAAQLAPLFGDPKFGRDDTRRAEP